MKNSINTFKLVRNAQCKQQANAQSDAISFRMQSLGRESFQST